MTWGQCAVKGGSLTKYEIIFAVNYIEGQEDRPD